MTTMEHGTTKALGDEMRSELVNTQNTSVATGLRQVEVLVAAELSDARKRSAPGAS